VEVKFLITGSNGQLAREFIRVLAATNHDVIAPSEAKLDISEPNLVHEAVSQNKPQVVINCAAYNLVDKAEEEFDAACRVNAVGARNLAIASKKHNALLVHFSTDYVFDGSKEDFYTEDDPPNPLNNYGKSKLLGERLVAEQTDDYLLFRLSWVFGEGRQNFLYNLLKWAEKSQALKVVCDEISVPTYTEDIVEVTMLAVANELRGIFHLTNGGYATRYEVARYFFEKLGVEKLILPVSSEYFPTATKRPPFSAMSNRRISEALSLHIPDWRNGVDRFIENILWRIR
jgi:dTDP-4-dehydrorhamnose reductase